LCRRGRPAWPQGAGAGPQREDRRKNPHLGRWALQFHQPIARRSAPQKHFISQNPHFCRSALSRYTPQDFIDLVQKHGIAFHEKHKGQLFCDHSAEDIIRMLLAECEAGGVTLKMGCSVQAVRHLADGGYELDTTQGPILTRSLVVATGGLSIPKIGATGWGYEVATQFGLRLVERRAGLVPLTFDGAAWAPYAQLAGLALPVGIEHRREENPHAL
jgi:predicted flavoprotein YhiN